MVWGSKGFVSLPARLLCIIASVTAFSFPDFNIYDASSTTMDKACSLFSSVIGSIKFFEPQVEDIIFQLRLPCERMKTDVTQTGVLRYSPFFDEKLKTVVIVTGWNSKLTSHYTEDLTNAYLCRGGFNLIVVDTASYIRTEYIKSAYNTEKLGEFVAIGLVNLDIPGKDIHLIGHSLGAHIVGSAGRHFTNATGEKIGRITGLDPARPCFHTTPVFNRLGLGDGKFIDIIHSNPGETGCEEPIGNVDFYPGGLEYTKPGCSSWNVACSHIRSVYYYAETVYHGNERNFMSSHCGNFSNMAAIECGGNRIPMGFATDESAKGVYILAVNDEAPYGINARGDTYLDSAQCGSCPM